MFLTKVYGNLYLSSAANLFIFKSLAYYSYNKRNANFVTVRFESRVLNVVLHKNDQEIFEMIENTERRKSIIRTAASAGRLFGSEKAAEITLKKKAVRALNVVKRSLEQGFLSPEEVLEELGLQISDRRK